MTIQVFLHIGGKEYAQKNAGLSTQKKPPRRYLWTDAFAVCNFLALYWQTRDKVWLTSAKELVDQVHFVLGRHRDDDPRTGWISGLDEKEGKQHPTRGGLRIGKPLNERRPDEPFDQNLPWGSMTPTLPCFRYLFPEPANADA